MASTARAGTQARVPRPPGWTPSAAITATCAGRGRAGTDRAGVADLEIVWLVPAANPGLDANHGDGGVRAARYCRGCAPTGPLGEVSCAGCGGGPTLSGALGLVSA